MTKKNLLKIAIPSAIVLTAAVIFCGSYADNRCVNCGAPGFPEGTRCTVCFDDNCPNVIGKSRYCIHPIDQEYTEPTVKPGKYYLNGDINSAYMEVTENTWQIIPTETCDFQTLYSLERSAFIDESLPAIKTEPDEIIDIEPNCNEDKIAFYSMPHEYTVVTWHSFDVIWLSPSQNEAINTVPQEYWRNREDINSVPQLYWQNGTWITQGPQLIDENTLQCYGGEYIMIE
ncbi:MAG: hypothetical protein K2J11_07010 [Oscillospiraceae bacterium]|nr:hypothetical protein [Oscillospiraceae bacterium]